MKTTPLPERIAKIAAITRMERGRLSVIRTDSNGKPFYNLQRREDGRNVTEYISREDIPIVQENIAAYEEFKQLVDEHLNEVSAQSREARKDAVKKKRQKPNSTTSPKKKKSKN